MEKTTTQPPAYAIPFWEGCRDHKLRYQACAHCGTVQLIPRTVCTHCHSQELRWKDSAGHGAILSYTIVYRAPTPAFKADTPYVIALIDMDEGFRLMTNVRGGANDSVAIGRRVRIGFEVRGDRTLPIAEMESP